MLLGLALAAPPASGAARPLTVDDLLKVSHVGRAIARPGTDTFVWEQSPPYDTVGDYGAGDSATWWDCDYAIWMVGPRSPVPKPLFKPRAHTFYVLGNFSGDGRFLTLLAARGGRVRVAVYDFRRRRLREYPLAPRIPPAVPGPDWAWLDNRHVAIAAYPGQEGPWQFTFRRAIGDRLAQSWARSWRGKVPSVDQYDSSAKDTGRPLPGRLVVLDPTTGRVRQLASGQFSGLHPSPDGRWLAAARQSSLPQSTLENPRVDWTYARSTLTVFSLAGSPRAREIAPDMDMLPDSVVWNPSSKLFAFFAWHGGAGLRSGAFSIGDPSNAMVKVVPHQGLSLASQRARAGPQWPERAAWLGDSLIVFARSTPDQAGTLAFEDIERDGIVDPRAALASIPPHWFLVSPDSTPRDLTPGMRKVSPVPVLADGTQFVIGGDGATWKLDASGSPVRFSPAASLPQASSLLQTFPGTEVLAIANSGMTLTRVGAGKGARLALMRPGADPKMLGEINPFLDQITETRWTDFHYANAQGAARAELSGCLLLPADYHADRQYPLIVEVYPDRPGGCAAPDVRNRFAMAARPTAYSEHLLAAHGFVVFRPDTGGGLARTADGPQAGLAAVVDRGVDAVLAAGYADPARVGLMGFSQGGFAALWLATQSQRYRAVVSLNGWSDLANNFFEMNWAQELVPTEMTSDGGSERYLTPAGSYFNMSGTPWDSPERYIANSPLWLSDKVSAPVLLVHSDMDQFDDASYKLFFTSLYIQKKDARLLIYRGEGHAPSSPANIRHLWQNIFSWFDVNFKPKL